MLFLDQLRINCKKYRSKTAIRFRDGASTRSVTYRELLEGVSRSACWLASQGVGPADRVAACLPKSLAGFQLHLAACGLGAVSVPLNPASSVEELRYLVGDSGAKLLVVPSGFEAEPDSPAGRSDLRTTVVAIDPKKFEGLPTSSGVGWEWRNAASDQLALMLYTSGTTGRPKGACITHGSLTANLDMLEKAWQWSAADTLLHALPLFHLHGLLVALHGALHAGATCIMHPRFDAVRIAEDLQSGECSVFMAVPTMYRRILAAIGHQEIDLRHMRLLTSGSDRLPVEVFERIERQLGHRVVERYGMTETGIMLSNPLDGDRIAGQVGIPLPGVEMRVADPGSGALCEHGVVGEFQTKGPHVFAGYWHDARKTEESFTEDGWFRTGDIGLRDEQGRYELKSRLKDIIISGGLNVYPVEVEHVLARHPDVDQCAVVGIRDEDWGEAVTAFMVSANPKTQARELARHCRKSLAAYKTPKRFVFLEGLPRNAMGKVQKDVLARSIRGDSMR